MRFSAMARSTAGKASWPVAVSSTASAVPSSGRPAKEPPRRQAAAPAGVDRLAVELTVALAIGWSTQPPVGTCTVALKVGRSSEPATFGGECRCPGRLLGKQPRGRRSSPLNAASMVSPSSAMSPSTEMRRAGHRHVFEEQGGRPDRRRASGRRGSGRRAAPQRRLAGIEVGRRCRRSPADAVGAEERAVDGRRQCAGELRPRNGDSGAISAKRALRLAGDRFGRDVARKSARPPIADRSTFDLGRDRRRHRACRRR